MFFLKKITVYLLAVIFIFTITFPGLGAKTDPESIPMYEETDIGKNAGINHPQPIIRMNSKQQLVIYDILYEKDQKINRFVTISPEGKLLSEFKADFTGNGHVFALDPHDNLYMATEEHIKDPKTGNDREVRRKLSVYNPKGKNIQTIDLGKSVVKDDQRNYIRDMAIDSKGNVYLVIYNEGLSVLIKNTKTLKSFRTGSNYFSIDIDPTDNLIACGYNDSTYTKFIEKMKLPSGEQIWKTSLETSEFFLRIFYNSADKSIYALGRKRIEKYDVSGKFSGIIFDFTQQDLMNEDIQVNGLVVDLKSLYLAVSYPKESKDCIKKYTISDAKSGKNQKTLTIGVSKSYGNFLESACGIFRKTHPGWTVNVKEYLTGSDYTGYQKTLNTELLAGKGPDIIAVSMLPYLKYCEKNIFLDLNDFIDKEKDLDRSKFDLDTIKACEYKGKLYVLPISFNLQILYANQTLLERAGIKIDDRQWTWQDFLDIAIKVTKDTNNDGVIDQYALPKMNDISLFYDMWKSACGRLLDYEKKTADFDSPGFRELLSLYKSFTASKVVNPQVDVQKFFDGQGRGSIVFAPMTLGQYFDPVYIREQLFHDKITMLSLPGTGPKGIRFDTLSLYAINNYSRFKNEAWDLLKIMCSDELQNSSEIMSFPINLSARKAKAEYAMTKVDSINGKKVAQMLTKEELNQINGLLGRIGGHLYIDSQLWEISYTEVTKFINGEKTAQEVGKIIQNKVNTYLNE